ncbi:SDR family oxidoreductase [uncultured Tistrella sp.]|uniref:SDR family oxidoreductase n=1 Tax=Tistrella mobilis TaxID=171437 RepID=UPI000C0B71D6|nr:NmrA family NAD(P)-binding protein [uncultured Tistrella sp.]MAM73357.1 hypothetical protein [Tistrella sp.]
MKKILVIGATGPQGRPVAQKLAAAGYEVTALVRDPARAAGLADIGVRLAAGDLEDAAAVRPPWWARMGCFC